MDQEEASNIIHKQIYFLDNLRRTKPENILPCIPMLDFSSVIKKVARERRKKINEQKWKTFLDKQKRPLNLKEKQGKQNDSGVKLVCHNRDVNFLQTNGLNVDHTQMNKLHHNKTDQAYLKKESNVFIELLEFKKLNAENVQFKTWNTSVHELTRGPNFKINRQEKNSKTTFPIFDFNTLLEKVKRERKRKQDEEKWKTFLRKQHQLKMPQNEVYLSKELSSSEELKIYNPNSNGLYNIDNDNQCSLEINNCTHCPESNELYNTGLFRFNSEIRSKKGSPNNPQWEHSDECNYISPNVKTNNQSNDENCRQNNTNREEPIEKLHDEILMSPAFQLELSKLEQLFYKLNVVLSELKCLIIKNNTATFTNEDLSRIKQRTIQFGLRFKRNYAYRSALQLNDLKMYLLNSDITATNGSILLARKLMSAYQGIIQASLVVEKQLKTSTAIELIKEFLCEFLQCVYELDSTFKFIYENWKIQNETGNLLLEIIDELKGTKCAEEILSKQTKQDKCEGKKYKPPPWIKNSTALARTKFGPPVRLRNEKSIQIMRSENELPSNNKTQNDFKPEFKETSNMTLGDIDNFESLSPMNEEQFKEETVKKNSTEEIGTTERSISKIIAKNIQEVPGVDEELRKVEDTRIKMMPILLNIKAAIVKRSDKSIPPDEDIERIKQRTLEFGARFKRNYFYRIKCQVHELRNMDTNLMKIKKKSTILLIIQKLTTAHHSGLQALQVIEKQLQTTISVIGFTEDLLCSFYHFVYEITFMLKPFYGYLKTQILDDVEKLVVDTITVLQKLKLQQAMKTDIKPSKVAATAQQKYKQIKGVKKKTKGKVSLRKATRFPEKKAPKGNQPRQNQITKGSTNNDKNPIQNNTVQDSKDVPFMMTIKQRPGAEVRRSNFDNEDDPKTMVEILAEHELNEHNIEEDSHKDELKLDVNSDNDTNLNGVFIKPEESKVIQKNNYSNTKLIIVKQSEAEGEEQTELESERSSLCQSPPLWENMVKFRKDFIEYPKTNSFVKKSLQSVKRLTERLTDETLLESFQKIISQVPSQDLTRAFMDLIEDE